ncbi:MAG: pilus assembly protein [Ramlibacter sp.]|nr:pilus assembly protein [Ramlibacter sp.]HLU79201.1 type II secretion system F family protein [Burkholderiaceae bacterium]
MELLILMLASAWLAAVATWLGCRILQQEYGRYRATFQHDTVHSLADFFVFLDPRQLWGANLALACAVGGMSWLMLGHPVPAGVTGLLTLVLPRKLLRWARQRRFRRVDAQLPDFLLALAGALRSGAGLQKGLQQVCEHVQRPLGQELSLLLQQQRVGVNFSEALDALQQRLPTESVALVVATIKVAGHTGGSLADTLEQISRTLRTRLQLMGKVRALTSQGRMQAWIMGGLPPLLIAALYRLDPVTMEGLWTTPAGWAVLLLVGALEFLGITLVRRIVNIEV